MLRVGLTGTMGSGKSTVGRMLAARGAAVIDTDELAREVTAPGTPGHAAILAAFGPAVEGPAGHLDRRALAGIVFGDPEALARLEAIVHPLVGERVAARLQAMAAPVAVVEVPLLDGERARRYGLDRVVLVDSPPDLAAARAGGRGFAADDVAARQQAQPGTAQRRELADRVVTNDGTPEQLEAGVDELWAWLQAGAPRGPGPAGKT